MNDLGLFGATSIDYLNPASTTDHGATTMTWTGEWQTLDGCDLQEPATATASDNREGTLSQYTLYLPYDAPILDNARVRYLGQELQVDGMILRVSDPLGLLPYAKATLTAWRG
jgi:hypothetical protein